MYFETDVTILRERQWLPFARQHQNCYDSEALPSELWCEDDKHFSVIIRCIQWINPTELLTQISALPSSHKNSDCTILWPPLIKFITKKQNKTVRKANSQSIPQDRQCTHNVTLRCLHATTVVAEECKYYIL